MSDTPDPVEQILNDLKTNWLVSSSIDGWSKAETEAQVQLNAHYSRKFQAIAFDACRDAVLSAPDERDVMESIRLALKSPSDSKPKEAEPELREALDALCINNNIVSKNKGVFLDQLMHLISQHTARAKE